MLLGSDKVASVLKQDSAEKASDISLMPEKHAERELESKKIQEGQVAELQPISDELAPQLTELQSEEREVMLLSTALTKSLNQVLTVCQKIEVFEV